jgi:glucose/arabinose dehydrogenase
MRRVSIAGLALLLTALAPTKLSWSGPQVAGFSQGAGAWVSGLSQITSMAWATDGSNLLFVTQRSGEIRAVVGGTLQSANVAIVGVVPDNGSNGETGLENVIVDLNYSSNKYIYVFATVNSTTQRVFRYTIGMSGSNYVASGQTQMGPDLPDRNVNHNGGGLAMGTDGYLYAACGNLGNGNHIGSDGYSDEWTALGSKIIRINPATPTVAPSSNPWYNDATHTDPNVDWMYAKGFRNPFGLRMRPGTSELWLTEVGDWYEQIFRVTAGSDQGWKNGGGYGGDSPADSGGTAWDDSTNGNNENNRAANNTHFGTNYLVPALAYRTNGHPYGGCITRGNFYTGTMFPASYQGNFFFVDYNSGNVMYATVNGTHDGFTSDMLFVTGNSSLTDVNTGPDGALYYCSIGGSIYRLSYTGTATQNIVVSTSALTINEGGNGTFGVHLAADPGAGGLTVTVARSSGDTDVTVTGGASLTFTSGNYTTNQTVTIHAATDADTTNDTATITCSSGALTPQNVAVTVNDSGNAAPSATLTQPTNGAVISGTNVDFFGQGSDPQGSATLARAEFYIDGVLRYTDPYVAATGHFHYGGGHLLWNTTSLSNGPHTLTMTVYDNGGLSGSATVNITIDNSGGSNGFVAQYYNDANLGNLVMTRVDPAVNFNWGTGSPDSTVPADNFSVRWTGSLTPAYGETYTFFVNSDDGARLWVNGVLLVDKWVNQSATEWSGTIALTAGVPVSIVLEYYDSGGGAVAQLSFSSASQIKIPIPSSAMSSVTVTTVIAPTGAILAGCGLTGLEGAMLLGLLALIRRKRR